MLHVVGGLLPNWTEIASARNPDTGTVCIRYYQIPHTAVRVQPYAYSYGCTVGSCTICQVNQ
eukprot:COSAG01_NODE_3158_length_6489_cov_2.264945_8_plen_62_part_00